MRAVGIVAEYNPFHRGHEHQLRAARETASADVVIVIMSGNFVQRGGPAVADKWKRAEWALNGGADLVLELPTIYATADAGRFAQGAVGTLEAIGCDALSMGSECGDLELLRRVRVRLDAIEDSIGELMQEEPNLSYPAAREKLYRLHYSDTAVNEELAILDSANDNLALNYMKYSGTMDIVPVRRIGAGYNDSITAEAVYQSATGIRNLITEGADYSAYVPDYVDCNLMPVNQEEYFRLVRYAIINRSSGWIDELPSGGEGLGAKLRESVLKAGSLEELIQMTKSKRHTYSRVARLITQLVLELDRSMYSERPGYARVLGFNDRGRAYMKELRDSSECLLVTNLSKQLDKLDERDAEGILLDIHAANVYSIITGRDIYSNSDYVKFPIIK